MKWVKTNNYLPTEHKEYVVRLTNGLTMGLTFIPGKAEWYLQENVIEWLDESDDSKRIESAIEIFLSKIKVRHSHKEKELLYGYCGNGEYELYNVDIKELSEFISNDNI